MGYIQIEVHQEYSQFSKTFTGMKKVTALTGFTNDTHHYKTKIIIVVSVYFYWGFKYLQ